MTVQLQVLIKFCITQNGEVIDSIKREFTGTGHELVWEVTGFLDSALNNDDFVVVRNEHAELIVRKQDDLNLSMLMTDKAEKLTKITPLPSYHRPAPRRVGKLVYLLVTIYDNADTAWTKVYASYREAQDAIERGQRDTGFYEYDYHIVPIHRSLAAQFSKIIVID